MQQNKEHIIQQIEKTGIIPIYNHDETEQCKKIIELCFKGGIRVFEFTNRSKKALSIFSELIPFVEKAFPEMSLGIGTILNEKEAESFIKVGAHFIVSPIVDLPTADVCLAKNILWIPGCFTPSEIVTCYNAGATVVKLFPASVLTPSFLKSIKAPLPFVKCIVTGGIAANAHAIKPWLQAGAVGVGLGSGLFATSEQEVSSTIQQLIVELHQQ